MNSKSKSFWNGKKVLITGHTGFKGSWLSIWLKSLGAEVTGISLPPDSSPSLYSSIDTIVDNSFIVDITNYKFFSECIMNSDIEIVFHMAAQALVLPGYENPVETFETNLQGTVNVLNSLRSLKSLKCIIAVTTDKVYLNDKTLYPYRESDTLGGYDPYSASKACAELAIECYRKSFFNEKGVAISSVRAGNVIGGGDWSKCRLIPDMMKAWENNKSVNIRSPYAIRPWQHVLEPLYGYMELARQMWIDPSIAGSFNFGPNASDVKTVKEVVLMAKNKFIDAGVQFNDKDVSNHESIWLSLDNSKSRKILNIEPKFDFRTTIDITVDWYKKYYSGGDAYEMCINDIHLFESNKN
jgi:CDP-glucose 4,6-dehydratase